MFINDPKQFTFKHYVVGKSVVMSATASYEVLRDSVIHPSRRYVYKIYGDIISSGTVGAIDVTRPGHGLVTVTPFVDNHDAEIIYDMPLSHPRKAFTVGSGGTFQELLFSGTLSASLSMNNDLRLNHRFTTSGFVYGKTDTGRDSISFGGLDRDG